MIQRNTQRTTPDPPKDTIVDDIKRQAAGRCSQILQSVCGLTDHQLNPKVHGPCPDCGGTDRFRAFDDVNETGGLLCNQCGKRSDLFASIQWLRRCTFPEAMELVADEIGHNGNGHHKAASKPAKPKRVHATSKQAADALAYGMTQAGILAEKRMPDAGWQYHNVDGSDAFTIYRWDLPDGQKEIRQASAVPGGWITSAMPESRPLYRLPELVDAAEVWICEGEKAADAAVSLGLNATTSAGGSNAAEKSDWRPLNGKRVYILPDHDEPGEKFTRAVVELIRKQAPNATVQVKRLKDDWPEIPDGGDVFDWQEHFDTADAETLRARLDQISDCSSEFPKRDDNTDRTRPDGVSSVMSSDFEPKQWKLKSAWDAITKPVPMRSIVIQGLARRGEVVNIIASTKVGKSWLALLLLLCISTGRDWFGRKTAKGRVLLLDNELHDETIQNRLHAVADACGIVQQPDDAAFDYIDLRGEAVGIGDVEYQLSAFQPGELTLIVLDAKYRFFGNGRQENSNDDQTEFHNAIDQLAKRLDCVIVLIHHATKGDQGTKSVTDVGSGGGSQSRTVDCHMVIRPHEGGDDMAVLDAAVRTFAPVEPQTIRWKFPLWTADTSVEPKVKQAQTRNDATVEKSQKTKISTILDMLRRSPDGIETENKLSCNNPARTSFRAALKELEGTGEITFVDDYIPRRCKQSAPAWRLAEGSHSQTSTHTPHYKEVGEVVKEVTAFTAEGGEGGGEGGGGEGSQPERMRINGDDADVPTENLDWINGTNL